MTRHEHARQRAEHRQGVTYDLRRQAEYFGREEPPGAHAVTDGRLDLTPEDTEVMWQVADFVAGQEENPPPAGPTDDDWRRSLMTVGHAPLRA